MGMMIVVAWAGEQLLVVSGTGVMIIGEDLSEGRSWTIGVFLLVTVGMVLLCWTLKKCDERTRGCKAAELHDFEKRAS